MSVIAKTRRRVRGALVDFVLKHVVADTEYWVVIETLKEIQHEALLVVEHPMRVSAATPADAIDQALDAFRGPQPWYSVAVYAGENAELALDQRWNIDQRVATRSVAP